MDFRMDRAATSGKTAAESQLIVPALLPHEFHFENYLNVPTRANFLKYYWNTSAAAMK